MPRKSPYEVHLSSVERLSLESSARKYTSPYCDVIRAKIILLADQGLPNDLIATKLNTPRQDRQQVAQAICFVPTAWPGGATSRRA
jgi:hypothetical protein